MPNTSSSCWPSAPQPWYRHLHTSTGSQDCLGMASLRVLTSAWMGEGNPLSPCQHHLPAVSHGEGSELGTVPTLWVTAVSSLQHPFQGDIPLSDHLLLPLLGVPALDGSSKLWRYQGKSGFSCPLWGGKRREALVPQEQGAGGLAEQGGIGWAGGTAVISLAPPEGHQQESSVGGGG